MFIGARVAYYYGDLARAGIIIGLASNTAKIKFDDNTVTDIPWQRIQLINNWKTYKKPKDHGFFRNFLLDTPAKKIYNSPKAIVFSEAGIRAVWYWSNHLIFDDKLSEPQFKLMTSNKNRGLYSPSNGKSQISISTTCHTMSEMASTVIHESIHQMNVEVEHSDYENEGSHGASFLRWIPIIKAATGLDVGVKGLMIDNFECDESIEEPKTAEFIFIIFKYDLKNTTYWQGILVDSRENLPILYGSLNAWLRGHFENGKIYAGRSNLLRIKNELNPTKNGVLPRNFKRLFSPGLINILEKNVTPITGYRPPSMDNL